MGCHELFKVEKNKNNLHRALAPSKTFYSCRESSSQLIELNIWIKKSNRWFCTELQGTSAKQAHDVGLPFPTEITLGQVCSPSANHWNHKFYCMRATVGSIVSTDVSICLRWDILKFPSTNMNDLWFFDCENYRAFCRQMCV